MINICAGSVEHRGTCVNSRGMVKRHVRGSVRTTFQMILCGVEKALMQQELVWPRVKSFIQCHRINTVGKCGIDLYSSAWSSWPEVILLRARSS